MFDYSKATARIEDVANNSGREEFISQLCNVEFRGRSHAFAVLIQIMQVEPAEKGVKFKDMTEDQIELVCVASELYKRLGL